MVFELEMRGEEDNGKKVQIFVACELCNSGKTQCAA